MRNLFAALVLSTPGLAAVTVVALGALVLASCIPNAALRRGDAAAARGDWRAAERQYRQALDLQPNDVELATKYNNAKARAVDAAARTAEVCRTAGDLACVERELSFALWLDPSNAAAAEARARARQSTVHEALAVARRYLDGRDPVAAWRELDRARPVATSDQLHELTSLQRHGAVIASELVQSMLERAAAPSATDALDLFERTQMLADAAAEHDPQFAALAASVRTARQRAVDARLVVLREEATRARTSGDYVTAARASEQAYAVSRAETDSRAARYSTSMHAARDSQARRAFAQATAHLRDAVATGLDDGQAHALLEAVEPRVYRIRLESVAITPTKPGTSQPWVGKSWLAKVAPAAVGAVVSFKAGPQAGTLAHNVAAAVTDVHPENRPTLFAQIDLPDGRRLVTRKVKGTYVIYGAEFYVVTNKLDARTVRVALFHERRDGNESVAVSNVPLGQIVAGQIDVGAVSGDASALQEMVFATESGESWQDGKVVEATIVDGGENLAATRLTPTPSAARARLVSISVSLPEEGGDGDGSHPDPYIEIYKSNRQILKTRTAQDTRGTEWAFAATDLYLEAQDQFTVKLVDADFSSDDHIASWQVSAGQLLSGSVHLTTTRGTTLTLRTGPPQQTPR